MRSEINHRDDDAFARFRHQGECSGGSCSRGAWEQGFISLGARARGDQLVS